MIFLNTYTVEDTLKANSGNIFFNRPKPNKFAQKMEILNTINNSNF